MLEKKVTYDHSITETKHIQVRRITRIMEDGKEISKAYHRHVVSPGADTTGQDPMTTTLAKMLHTPEVVKTYQDMVKAREL